MRCRDCGAEVSEYDISCEVCGCIDFVEDGYHQESNGVFNPMPPSTPTQTQQNPYKPMEGIGNPTPQQNGYSQMGEIPQQQNGYPQMGGMPTPQPQQNGYPQMPNSPMQGQQIGYIVMQQQAPMQAQAPLPIPEVNPVAPSLAPISADKSYDKRKLLRTLKNILWYAAIIGVVYYVVFVYLGYTPDGLWDTLTGEAVKVPPAQVFKDGGM